MRFLDRRSIREIPRRTGTTARRCRRRSAPNLRRAMHARRGARSRIPSRARSSAGSRPTAHPGSARARADRRAPLRDGKDDPRSPPARAARALAATAEDLAAHDLPPGRDPPARPLLLQAPGARRPRPAAQGLGSCSRRSASRARSPARSSSRRSRPKSCAGSGGSEACLSRSSQTARGLHAGGWSPTEAYARLLGELAVWHLRLAPRDPQARG